MKAIIVHEINTVWHHIMKDDNTWTQRLKAEFNIYFTRIIFASNDFIRASLIYCWILVSDWRGFSIIMKIFFRKACVDMLGDSAFCFPEPYPALLTSYWSCRDTGVWTFAVLHIESKRGFFVLGHLLCHYKARFEEYRHNLLLRTYYGDLGS